MLTQTLQYHLSLAISLIPPLLGNGSPAGAAQTHSPQKKAVREAGTCYPGDSGNVSLDRKQGPLCEEHRTVTAGGNGSDPSDQGD